MLAIETHGEDTEKTPLLIAHGLFGSAKNWRAIARRMSSDRLVIAVDMRNHGDSPRFPTNSYPDMAEDLAKVLESAVIRRPAHVLGHSMGGKTAMTLALTRPDLIDRLIVADIAPVAYSHTQMHLVDAMRAIDLRSLKTRSDADRQLQTQVDDRGVRAFLLQSLDVREQRWRINLDVLAEDMDKILGFPSFETRFDGPSLFLAGALSDYVQRDARGLIKTLFPNAFFAKIPGAGHWLHADNPEAFVAAVETFLKA